MTHKLIATVAALAWLAASPAAAADAAGGVKRTDVKRTDKVDFAKFTCADALKLKESDAPRYAEAAQWLAGWLAEPKVALDVSLPAITAAGERWATACAERPDAKLKDVAERVVEKKGALALSALKCQEFLDLDAADHDAALGLIRWLDGWNARAVRETTANFYYHKKQMQSATDGCMKYPRRVLAYVVAGKYR